MSIEGAYRPQEFFAPPDDRTDQSETGTQFSGEQPEQPEVHYEGTPIVTVRLVNGVQQDIPHLYVDSKNGQTRWWVEREPIETWQERVRAAQESGDERYTDISPDRIPSTVVHTYPNIPASVLERQPEYRDREWMTLSYSLTASQESNLEKHTILMTTPSAEDETTSFRRSLSLVEVPTLMFPEANSAQVFIWREEPEETVSPDQTEPNPQAITPKPENEVDAN